MSVMSQKTLVVDHEQSVSLMEGIAAIKRDSAILTASKPTVLVKTAVVARWG